VTDAVSGVLEVECEETSEVWIVFDEEEVEDGHGFIFKQRTIHRREKTFTSGVVAVQLRQIP